MKDTWFVKIYRKLLENPISWNLELLWLVTALLLKANHKSNSFFLWTQKFTVDPWQFISSQVKLSVEFWMNRNKMIRLLKLLEDEKIVNIKWYSKYSLFTIVNRDKYQTQWTSNDTATVTSNEQQVNTNKNDKKEKNDKKKKTTFSPPTLDEVKDYFTSKWYTEESGERAFEYYNVAWWIDWQGKQVRNWKQKMNSVWFKEENKKREMTMEQWRDLRDKMGIKEFTIKYWNEQAKKIMLYFL